MVKAPSFIFIILSFIFLLFSAINFAMSIEQNKMQQQNHAPVVKIISPANNSTLLAGAQVHYSVTVSDKEDGESKYDEINQKEVLLEVKYINNESKLAAN